MSQCFTAEQMGNSSTETKSDKLKNSYIQRIWWGKSSKKIWGKKMFYKLFGSKQNSALNGRDI